MTDHDQTNNRLHTVYLRSVRKICMNRLTSLIYATLAGLCCVSLLAQAGEVPKSIPDVCDREWDRIKGIPPMQKPELDRILRAPDKVEAVVLYTGEAIPINIHKPSQGLADLYYLLARLPFVIGAEELPTEAQRDEWLDKAASLGHVSAKAALLRLRYLSKDTATDKRPTRKEYLLAALDAGQAGDPEFAAVLMDTAQDRNAPFHCRPEDRNKSPTANGCNAQDVVKPIETRKWAEAAALGGHPHAKNLLCTMHFFGTYPQLGFEKDEKLAFQWCWATHQTACSVSWNVGLLSSMYENGKGTDVDLEKAKALRKKYPTPFYLRTFTYFPLIAR